MRAGSSGREMTRPVDSNSKMGSLGVYEEPGSGVTRPKIPAGYPPGTEYLPPEVAGQTGPVMRGFAIALTEGMAAAGSQFFRSLSKFAGDTTAWHPHAGKWRYGDKYGKQPKK
jgi:hypothetical protein